MIVKLLAHVILEEGGGTLCGRCVVNTTESLFSANCFQIDRCYTLVFGLLYAACVVMYSIFLAIYDDIKKEFIKRALKLFKKIKNMRKSREIGQSDDDMIDDVYETASYSSLVKALLLADYSGNFQLHTLKVIDKKDNDMVKTSTLVEALLLHNSYHNRKLSFSDKVSIDIKDDDLIVEIKKKDVKVKIEGDKSDTDSGMKYVQIILYYVQDATLFKIYLPDTREQTENALVKILQFSPEILTVYYKVSDLCFTKNTTAVMKVILSSMFGPCIILFLSLIYIIHWMISRYLLKAPTPSETLKSRLTQAFSLIQCVDIDNNKVLYIQGDIQCYTWWQTAIEVQIYFSILPMFITLTIFPFWVKEKQMSVGMLILACLLPIPVLVYLIIVAIVKARKNYIQSTQIEKRNIHVALHHMIQFLWYVDISNKSSTSSSNEASETADLIVVRPDSDELTGSSSIFSDTNRVCEKKVRYAKTSNETKNNLDSTDMKCKLNMDKLPNDLKCPKYNNTQEVVSHILLKHYRPLHFFGLSMTWLGVHKLYRVALVACYTYIKEPLPRLSTMAVLAIAMMLASSAFKPYSDDKANKAANLSYIASIFIAIINVSKSWLNATNYEANSDSIETTTLQYFDLCESILVSWLPVIAILIWMIYFLGEYLYSKLKKRKKSKQ